MGNESSGETCSFSTGCSQTEETVGKHKEQGQRSSLGQHTEAVSQCRVNLLQSHYFKYTTSSSSGAEGLFKCMLPSIRRHSMT